MNNRLPTPNIKNIRETGDEIDKIGVKKYLRNLFFTFLQNLPIYLIIIFIQFLLIRREVSKIPQLATVQVKEPETIEEGYSDQNAENGSVRGVFNENDWTSDFVTIDPNGYLCPYRRGFPYWSLWMKEKINLDFKSLSMKFKFKIEGQGDYPRALIISLGEYVEKEQPEKASPEVFYRVNLFDGETRAVRIYDDKGVEQGEVWLEEEPDFSSVMSFTLHQKIPDPGDNKISLSFKLSYNPVGSEEESERKTIHFAPEKEIVVRAPSVDLKEGERKQIGVGVYKGDCIKLTHVKIGN